MIKTILICLISFQPTKLNKTFRIFYKHIFDFIFNIICNEINEFCRPFGKLLILLA